MDFGYGPLTMAAEPTGDLVISLQPFSFELDGKTLLVADGAILRRNHPIVRAQPGFFTPLVITVEHEPDLPPAALQVLVVGEDNCSHGWKMAGLKRRRHPDEREMLLP